MVDKDAIIAVLVILLAFSVYGGSWNGEQLQKARVELSSYRDQTACNLVAQKYPDSYNNLRCDALGWPKVGATVTCGCHWFSNHSDYVVVTKEYQPERERER